jgi:hypothetical protein
MTVLDGRALNRATLARQLLLERARMPALAAVEHLVGLQAQEPLEPYAGLWSRLHDFDPGELVGLLEQRRVVRTWLMRRTIHLVSAADCRALRALHQPMLEQRMRGALAGRLPGVDQAELAAIAAPLFAERPRTPVDVGREIAHRWPGVAARDIGDALNALVPLVQVPPRGVWGQKAPARASTVEAWLGEPLDAPGPADELVLRYLAAYGPAATADVRAWSGLAGLPAVVARLRPRLAIFRDERGRELLDLPDAPRPDPTFPAPPRFLPAFDNAVLGYADRSRIIDDAHRGLSVAGTRFVLVDGRVAATWTAADTRLKITVLTALGAPDRTAVVEEGERLMQLLTDGAGGSVTVEDP